jgi:hypothetical protein
MLTTATALEHLKANRTERLVPSGTVPDQRYFDILPAIGTARVANPNFTVPVLQLPSATLPGRFADEGAQYAGRALGPPIRRPRATRLAGLSDANVAPAPARRSTAHAAHRLLGERPAQDAASHVLHHLARDWAPATDPLRATDQVVCAERHVQQGVHEREQIWRISQSVYDALD